MRVKGSLMVMFLLFFSLVWEGVAISEIGEGIIGGKVINKTTGKTVSGQEVILHKYLNQSEVGKESAKTDEEGKFRFENLSVQPEYVYSLYAKYQEAEYWSEFITFKDKTTVEDARLIVYDSTSSDENVKVKLHHIIFDVQGETIFVKEVILFYNEGERAYIGKKVEGQDKRITLNFSLPEGFANMEYLQGLMTCCIIPAEGGFVDTMPVKPGPREIAFAYQLRYDSSKYLFRKSMDYDTDSLDILIPAGEVKISSQTISFASKTADIKDKSYLYLKAQEMVKAGTSLNLELSNLPANKYSLKVVVYSLVALLILMGIAYPFFRKGRATVSEKVVDEKESLIATIAQLDDRFQAGKISEKDYRALRKQKKESLMKLYKGGKKDI